MEIDSIKWMNLNCRLESLLDELERFQAYMNTNMHKVADVLGSRTLVEKKWTSILNLAESQWVYPLPVEILNALVASL